MSQNQNTSEQNTLKKMISKVIPGNGNEMITAEKAWVETTYGRNTYQPIEKRIENKIKTIKSRIEARCQSICGNEQSFSSYYCVVDIADDLRYHVEEVFKPFKENGFQVINLSEHVPELANERVFLVTWKNAFDPELKKVENEQK